MEKFNDTTPQRIYSIIAHISNAMSVDCEDRVVYLAGGIYASEKKLRKLLSRHEVDVVKTKSSRFGIYRFMPVPVPLDYLIRINDINVLLEIVKVLESPTAMMLYIFKKKHEKEFCNEFDFVSSDTFFMKKIAKKDPRHLFYGIDTDNLESSTGMMEYVSCGDKLSYKMKWFL